MTIIEAELKTRNLDLLETEIVSINGTEFESKILNFLSS
ncbi:unnamed protein product, partial [Rotaria sp. Silwood2]